MDAPANWQPIATAPKDGTKIWGWLYDCGIVLMHWMSAEDNCAVDGGDDPADYIACWVKSSDPDDGDWSPRFWLPFDGVALPPGVVWVNDGCTGKWRDAERPAHTSAQPASETDRRAATTRNETPSGGQPTGAV